MTLKSFGGLFNRLTEWKKSPHKHFKVSGLSPEHFLLMLKVNGDNFFNNNKFAFVFAEQEDADKFYDLLNFIERRAHIYPGLENSPYLDIYASEKSQMNRFATLNSLARGEGKNIVLTIESLFLKTVPKSFFEKDLILRIDDIIAPDLLASKLVDLGYSASTSIEEEGTFCKKGEIFDLYPVGHPPVRIIYFDELIEKIHGIDKETQKTLKDTHYESIIASPTPFIFSHGDYAQTLRENIPMPAPGQKKKYELRKSLFQALSDNILFDNHCVYTPLFFKKSETIIDYLPDEEYTFIFFDHHEIEEEISRYFEKLRIDYERVSTQNDDDNLLPAPQFFYEEDYNQFFHTNKILEINHTDIEKNLDDNFINSLNISLKQASVYFANKTSTGLSKPEFIKHVFSQLKDDFKSTGEVIISTQSENSKKEILHLFDILDFPKELRQRVSFISFLLSKGFYYETDKTLVISEADFFSSKTKRTKTHYKKNVDLFAEQLASLKVGDFVVHSEHGIGEYLGLESLEIGGNKTDYLVLLYKGNDKVYVPVYKMNLVQKHAESGSQVSIDSIRTNKFSALKSKVRSSIKQLAFDLLKLQAERQSSPGFSFSEADHEYNEFELAFSFVETPDQRRAIDDVLEAMHKPIPMDYLVCGDVGFGKTEVAMRAAYKAVLDKKQVAVLVPTTVLAFQHYNSFIKRFKDFPVRIEFLSRFKTAKEEKEIKNDLESGKIDILIGTHKLLGSTVRYRDLGLVVVDEEQRFGVGHKEKLKLLKSTVDFLTLTATPIPRTMQLAFLGIRDLSLIQTAPPRRQSIKSYIIKQDDQTLQTAIRKELNRGGQVFVVHNKVHDIEQYASYIKELVPEANIVFAHGQLPERELEKRMKDFYDGKFQVLIATTIIESGIDIPNANTMIVDRADTYGLSQLHQLRGRIGRSDKKAYCYFIIPSNRSLTEVAEKRLRALQTYADMGSGFHIANCDLEIRGAGDILGGEQSGHIQNIGLELYMELLKEAIHELRGEKSIIKKDIEISTPFASFIPTHYVSDSSERLKLYKKLSNCESLDQLEEISSELEDIYGLHPEEVNNLFMTLRVRVLLQSTGVKSVQVAGSLVSLNFDKNILEKNDELRNKVVEAFIKRPKVYKFTPDFKVIYEHKTNINQTDIVRFAEEIAKQIVPC